MSEILSALEKFISNYPNKHLVIAYSGGVDSQVLLHSIATLKTQQKISQTISAIHVNHGLSSCAKQWQNFAQMQCSALNVDLTLAKVDIENQAQVSLEAQAREARYQALERLSSNDALIITGHHQDDQVETFLLALKRGSGLKGLSSMGECSNFGDKSQLLLRPLLSFSRDEIVQYAQLNNQKWIEDESNADISFDRNFLRQNIVPLLKERWPKFSQTVVRSASHCQYAQSIIDEVAEQDLANSLASTDISKNITKNSLNIPSLLGLSPARFNNAIRFFLAENRQLMPSQQQLVQLHNQLLNASADKVPEVKVGNVWLRRYQEQLFMTPEYQPVSHWRYEFMLKEVNHTPLDISLPDSLGKISFNITPDSSSTAGEISLSIPVDAQSVEIKFTHENPKCLPSYRQKNRPLKKVLQELAIPPWQRKRLPLLYIDGELAAVIGHFVCQPFLSDLQQKKLNIYWLHQSD